MLCTRSAACALHCTERMTVTHLRAAFVLALVACGTEPRQGAAEIAELPLPLLHESAGFLTGTWQRFDTQGELADRWTFAADGTFSIWTRLEGGGAFFGDFTDVSGTYTATDELLHLVGTTQEGWPFRYDTGYRADEEQLVRAPLVLTQLTASASTWTGFDDLWFYPAGSAYPFETRMAPTLVLHTGDPDRGGSLLSWIDPIGHDLDVEHGTFQIDGSTVTIDHYGAVSALEQIDPRTLIRRDDDPWTRGLSDITFFHPMRFGLRYRRAP